MLQDYDDRLTSFSSSHGDDAYLLERRGEGGVVRRR